MSKIEKSDTDHQGFWQMVLETFTSSGLSVRQFCLQEGLSEASFYAWQKKLVQTQPSDGKKNEVEPKPFIEVSLPHMKPPGLELILASGHTLRIPSGVDRQILAYVLSILREMGLC